MSDNVHEIAAGRLRRIDQRYTTKRRALVDVLARTDRPLTIHEVLERDRGLPQSSVYRNLACLERAGVVQRIVTNDEFTRFELAEEVGEHHHHLICSSCGTVRDFTVSAQVESNLGDALRRVAKRNDFAIDHHRLDLVGTCTGCLSGG